MNSMYRDTHAHLTSAQVFPEIEEVLARAQKMGVDRIVNICTDVETLERGIALRERYPWIFTAAATTPHDVEKEGESFFPLVKEAVERKQLIALGETGLDYYYEHSNREKQQEFLLRYFELAQESRLPLIFHCRDAFSDLFSLADSSYKNSPAVLHCFTGTLAEAKGVLDRGWYLSCSGIITFKKSEELREVIQYVPLDRLLIETDTPYLAPQSKRGKMNEPSFIVETAERIAQIKKIDLPTVAAATAKNADQFFSF